MRYLCRCSTIAIFSSGPWSGCLILRAQLLIFSSRSRFRGVVHQHRLLYTAVSCRPSSLRVECVTPALRGVPVDVTPVRMPSYPGATPLTPSSGDFRTLSFEAEAWAEDALRQMTLDEKLGQLLMIVCYGGFTPIEGAEFRQLAHYVERNHAGALMIGTRPGGLGIERSQVYPTAALVNLLQRRAKIPMLVAAD